MRARLGSDAAESLTPRELLERYFALRSTPPERLARLLAAADPLIEAPTVGGRGTEVQAGLRCATVPIRGE